MLLTIAIILLVLWLLGVTGVVAAIQTAAWLFLVVALVILALNFFRGRRPTI
jgi:hypothetical protein